MFEDSFFGNLILIAKNGLVTVVLGMHEDGYKCAILGFEEKGKILWLYN